MQNKPSKVKISLTKKLTKKHGGGQDERMESIHGVNERCSESQAHTPAGGAAGFLSSVTQTPRA